MRILPFSFFAYNFFIHPKQLYRCRACGRQSRKNPTPHAYPEARREEILHAYQERSSLRGLSRTFGVSRATVSRWIKKSSSASPLEHDLAGPNPEDTASATLELDELWSFVLKKANQVWVWIALCRKTRQIVGYALGDRSKQTCQRLWESIPSAYRQGHCFTDALVAYQAVIAFRAALGSGQRDGRNRPRRALEQYAPLTLGPRCPHDVVVFQVGGDARGLFAPLSPSLQSRAGHPSQMSHYPALPSR